MTKFILLLISAFSILLLSFQNKPLQYDVCVYGGTSAGVIAAYAAAKMGKSVILIEPGKQLGGLSAGGLGYTDIGNKYAITGLALDFYRRLGKEYGKFEQWIFEPHVASKIFNDYIKAAHLKVLYEYRIVRANKEDQYIKQIVLENSAGIASNRTITAKMFIDCSYEGDLMAKAGVSYAVGRESNNEYKETYNGVQLMEGHQFPDGVDPYKIPGNPASGLLWGISDEPLKPAGSSDKKLQAYNYRICLTTDAANRIVITRPENYDSSKYELLLRLFDAQPLRRTLNDYLAISAMPHQKTDINNKGGFSTDMIGMNYNYPEADYMERARIVQQHADYTKGLLYFLGHDNRVPTDLRNEMAKYGYPKDEYADNNNWSPQPYIRECRRMIGAYVMTQANCQGKLTVDDGVGLAAYTMDSHNCQRIVVNGMVKNEGNVEIGGFGPYPVSYRALIPTENECKNLLVPVCLSASHIAYGSIRMEPVFMELAQSASIAACMAIDSQKSVQRLDVTQLQLKLRNDPLLDRSAPEVLADNDDSLHTTISGNWRKVKSGGYGPSFLAIDPSVNESIVQFIPLIKVPGKYTVYSYLGKVAKPSGKTHYVVDDGKKNYDVFINRSDLQVEGQTSGEWISLGSYWLSPGSSASVTITNKDADGTIVADAILFVPDKKLNKK